MIVVIGRGIAGLAAAWELARAGRGPIHVFGPEDDRNAATAAAVGLSAVKGVVEGISPLMRAKVAGHELLPGWLAALERETGVKIHRRFDGVVEPWFEATGYAAIRGRVYAPFVHRAPLIAPRVEVLDCEALPATLKNLSRVLPQVQGVFHFPHDGWFDPRATLRALEAALRARGVEITSDRVVRILPHPDRGLLVECERRGTAADDVILAAGWWSSQILENSGCYHLRQRAFAGETLVADADDGICELLASFGKVNLVRVADQLLAGSSTYELAPIEAIGPTGPRAETRAALVAQLAAIAPGLIWPRTLFGVRGRLRDRLPAFGPVPLPGGTRRIFVCTGLYKNGLQLAPLFARSLSAALDHNQHPVPFSPARFAP